jgi:hypothetical protein
MDNRARQFDARASDIGLDVHRIAPDASSLDSAAHIRDEGIVGIDAGSTAECHVHSDCPAAHLCLSGRCIICAEEPDCNGNNIDDTCDLERGTSMDCNENQTPDECDLSQLHSFDCNQNDVLDECEYLDDGCTLFGRNDYVEYVAGNIPVIVSAPHGGTLQPTEIPARSGGTQVRDTNTTELARSYYFRMREHADRQPHLVLLHLHRSRLDANREIVEAAEGNPAAEQTWTEYHRYIEAAKRSISRQFGSGLYLDFHGLNASRTKIELGYLLTSTQLEIPDQRMSHPAYAYFTSIRTLARNSPESFESLLRGPYSLGTLLTAGGYDSVPSGSFPDPGRDASNSLNPYFRGGYNTVQHGSINGGVISGIQIEHNWSGVRDSQNSRAAYTRVLAESTETYLGAHFGLSMRARALIKSEQEFVEVLENGVSAVVRFRRRGDLSKRLALGLSYAGTATVNEDLTNLPSSVHFEAGQAVTELTITPTDDSVVEGPDTLEVFVDTSTSYNIDPAINNQPATTVILHDDERPTISIASEEDVANEPSDTRVLEISCLPPTYEGDAVLSFTGTAQIDVDYELDPSPSEQNNLLRLRFSPQMSSHPVRLQVRPDGEQEGTEHAHIQAIATDAIAASPRAPHAIQIYDEDIRSTLTQWWPGTIGNGALLNRVPGGHHGLLLPVRPNNMAPADDPILHRPAIQFDGLNDIVIIEDVETSSIANLSLSFWFYVPSLPTNSYGYLYSHRTRGASHYLHVYLSAGGTLKTAIRGSDDQDSFSALDLPQPISPGIWYHYALVVATSSVSTISKVYLDGSLQRTATRGGRAFDPPAKVFVGGRYDLALTRHFTGRMSDIRFYRRPLSDSEIQSLSAFP